MDVAVEMREDLPRDVAGRSATIAPPAPAPVNYDHLLTNFLPPRNPPMEVDQPEDEDPMVWEWIEEPAHIAIDDDWLENALPLQVSS